jgi:pheromone shutdown protein TraB
LPQNGEPTDAPRSRESVEALVECLKTQVHQFLDAVRDRGEVLASKIQEWMDTLVEAVAHGGAGMQAGLEGIRAAATGKNPVLAAIKGLVSGLSGQAKVALVLLLVFGLLLGPVVLVVLLLVLVVAALVAAVRAAAE